jgi:hypothetical protein
VVVVEPAEVAQANVAKADGLWRCQGGMHHGQEAPGGMPGREGTRGVGKHQGRRTPGKRGDHRGTVQGIVQG